MEANTTVDTQSEVHEPEPMEEVKPEFNLQLSIDRMTAYLSIKNASLIKELSFDTVYGFLQENSIAYGICEDEIHKYCKSGKYYAEFICAKGLPCVDGTDGRLEYKFNTQIDLKPKEMDNGSVDFRDLGLVQNVEKGSVLCQIIPPVPGKDGVDVYNKVITCKPGRQPTLPSGTNTVVSDDQLCLLAGITGCVEYKNAQVNVNDVFIVRGDVDSSSGNIHALGSVVVQGDVLEGFSIRAGKDVTIRGIVEGASIEAQGSILISNGMNGMGRGTLKANGNITAKYFENAVIECEGDVYADVMMNCKVQTEGSIILKGRKASLIGGMYHAGKMIVAKNIGTASHSNITVSIVSEELNQIFADGKNSGGMDELKAKHTELQDALQSLQEKITALTSTFSSNQQANNDRGRMVLKAAMLKKGQIMAAIESIEKEIKAAEEQTLQLSDYKVVASGIAYTGVKLEIGPYSMQLMQENSNTKFYANRDHIVFAPVLPSDMA